MLVRDVFAQNNGLEGQSNNCTNERYSTKSQEEVFSRIRLLNVQCLSLILGLRYSV